MKPAVFYITKRGYDLALKIQALFPEADVIHFSSEKLASIWHMKRGIICIMAAGIVVRTIAPLLEDKKTDPAVVVIDEQGNYVISLLSGHLGGANDLARKIAGSIGGCAVITTASDVRGKTALDLWAKDRGLYVEDYEGLKRLSMKMLSGQRLRLFATCKINRVPDEMDVVRAPEMADMIISEQIMESNALALRPASLFAGIGCNRGTSADEIEALVKDTFDQHRLSPHSLSAIASIDLKRDEKGLNEYVRRHNLDTRFYSGNILNAIAAELNMTSSDAVQTATGALAVAEPAAIAAALESFSGCEVLIPKIKRGNATLAVARAEFTL